MTKQQKAKIIRCIKSDAQVWAMLIEETDGRVIGYCVIGGLLHTAGVSNARNSLVNYINNLE